MDSDVLRALLTAAAWLVIVVVVRMLLNKAFDRYERRLAESDPTVAARRRTTFGFLLRVVIALVVAIGIWSVLSIFPATSQVASAFLGSAAVLAVIAGLALSTPLGNLGSGVLLAFTQPVRLGDEVELAGTRGKVEEIGLIYTFVRTDGDDRLVIPNETLASDTILNSTIRSREKVAEITVQVPLSSDLGAVVDRLRQATNTEVFVGDLAGQATIVVRARTSDPGEAEQVERELRLRAHEALRAEGVYA